jgi:hypothetical protein
MDSERRQRIDSLLHFCVRNPGGAVDHYARGESAEKNDRATWPVPIMHVLAEHDDLRLGHCPPADLLLARLGSTPPYQPLSQRANV